VPSRILPPLRGRRAWSYEHPVHAGVFIAFVGALLLFIWMLADSHGRWVLPVIFLPIDLVLIFVFVTGALMLSQRGRKR